MKYFILNFKYTFFLLVLFTSCKHNQEEKITEIPVVEQTDKISEEHIEAATEFKKEFFKLPLKKLPITDSTSFDSFIEAEDFKNINAASFKLSEIYDNWNNKDYNYKVISGYRVAFSNEFYSAVLTVKKGDHEMETTMINYDLKGNFIDSILIAYDEIAEGFFKTTSKLEKDKITIKKIEWTDEGHESIDVYKVNEDGKIAIMTNDESIINTVVNYLNLDKLKVKTDLIVQKFLKTSNETIVVIPEIVEEAEEYFSLNTHIVIYSNQTGKVTHTYFESSKTNNWISDAIRLDEIKIDVAPYFLTENTRAFGIRVEYFGSSRVNPYYNQTLSLFVKEKGTLKNILRNLSVEENTGEWDGACEGKFHDESKTLIMTKEKTNGYFDILVKSKIVESVAFFNNANECDEKETVSYTTSVLKFDGNLYK